MNRAATTCAALALLASACGASYEATGRGRTAPGADAVIEVDTIDGDNRRVGVDIQHLLPPGRVTDGATVYSVWIVPQGSPPILAGTLDYDEDDRTGQLTATTPHHVFEVRVTAESDPRTAAPSGDTVLLRAIDSE